MRFEEAFAFAETLIANLAPEIVTPQALPAGGEVIPPPRVGVGVSLPQDVKPSPKAFRVAIRAWSQEDLKNPLLHNLNKIGREETDIRITGQISAPPPPFVQNHIARTQSNVSAGSKYAREQRPLQIGYSVGHPNVTAGTIGCFVRKEDSSHGKSASSDALMILSNNHVLANSNSAKIGDRIFQPGPWDNGEQKHEVGNLSRFVRLRPQGTNLVDAAIASIDAACQPTNLEIPEIGPINGAWKEDGDELRRRISEESPFVEKVGRTTGRTQGRANAVLISLPVSYDGIIYRFKDVIEVLGETSSFSEGGDSGSLVVDADRKAVGLLFAGDGSATYLNPIRYVIDAFGVVIV